MARKQLTWTELRVGLFVLAGMFVLAIGIIYVTGTGILAAKYRLRTYLPEVEGLTVGAPVRLDGVEIGNVDAIRMNPKPADRMQNIEVIMRIDKRYQSEVRTDSYASLITEGLLGNRYVSIKRGFVGEPLQADATLEGREEAAIKQIVERGAELVQNLNALSGTAREIVEAVQHGRGTLGKLLTDEEAWNRLNASLNDVQQLMADTREGRNTVGKLFASDELYLKVDAAVNDAKAITADVRAQKGTLGKFIYDPTLYDNARQLVDRGNLVLADVREGRGTLGKLATDETLYNNLRDASASVRDASSKLNSTTGTAGKMFSDPQLYDNLTGVMGDLRLLIGDFRQNPKKFLRVKLSIF
jgi:phospholipid/cholesterol/gamma-HCH transport system substrate-binding protein